MELKAFYEQIGDYDEALKLFAGNAKMLTKFLKRFLSDKNYSNLIQAYERNDDNNVYRSARMLCEVCSSLSFTKLGGTSRAIAEAYQTGEAATRGAYNVPILMKTLAAQYECVVEAIRSIE